MKKSFTCALFLVSTLTLYCQFSLPEEVTNQNSLINHVTDFDLDGDPDYVSLSDNLFWFRNDGTGSFEKIQLTNSWDFSAQYDINVKDLNNDNYADIVYFDANEDALVCFYNQGGQGIGPRMILHIGMINLYAIGFHDIDDDGNMDIVHKISGNDFAFSVLFNDGNQQFNQQIYSYPTAINSFADLDLDGDVDLFMGGYGDFQIRYNNGTGVFQDTVEFSVPTLISNPLFFDVDLDNDVDIISGLGSSLNVIKNLGNGQFGPLVSTSVGYLGAYTVSDINYDTYPDLLITGAVSTYFHGYMLNNGTGSFAAPVSFNFSANPPMASGNNRYYGVEDFDGNGFLDILTGGQQLFKSTAPLSFQQGVRLLNRPSSKMTQMDVNTDGIKDLVYIAVDSMYYQLGLTDNTYSNTIVAMGGLTGYPTLVEDMIAGDFNQDGKEDLFYLIPLIGGSDGFRLFINNGNNTFTHTNITSVSYVSQPAVTNIDSDNFPDLVYWVNGSAKWIRNQGNLTFAAPVLLSNDPDLLGDLKCSDMDGDFDTDILLTKDVAAGYEIFYLPNNGNGAMGAPITIVQEPLGGVDNLFVFDDFDDDGIADFAYNHYVGITINRLRIYHGEGNGVYTLIDDAATNYPGLAKVADINHDNLKDICIQNGSNKFMVHFQDEFGGFSDAFYFPELIEVPFMEFDISGQNNDILMRSYNNDGIHIVKNNFDHHVRGKLFVDVNNSGVSDSLDLPIPDKAVNLLPVNNYYFSGSNGTFVAADLVDGNNQITPPAIPYFTITTNQQQYSFNSDALIDSIFNCEFGYSPVSVVEDLETVLTGGISRCNSITNYRIDLSNQGTTIPSGLIDLELDTQVVFLSSDLLPDSVVGQHLYWHYDSLHYFSAASITVTVQMPDFNSIGDTLSSYLTIAVTDASGSVLSTYTDSLHQILSCAYDPNDKTAIPAGIGAEGYIPITTEWLEYIVRFQNTGNDTATNVVIRDHLDGAFDWSSLEFVASSHDVVTTISAEGLVSFAFNFIHLPDSNTNEPASQGFIRYRVKLNDNQITGTQIYNTALIYFDYNPAVITNTTLNTLYDCNSLVNIELPTSVCLGSEVAGIAETSLDTPSVTWIVNGSDTQTGNLFSWQTTDTNTLHIEAQLTGNLCQVDTLVTITVSELPILQIDSLFSTNLCMQNGPIILPSVVPAGGTWQGAYVSGNEFDASSAGPGTHTVVYSYTDSLDCSGSDSILMTVEDCLGVDAFDDLGFSVYPNPFNASFTVEFTHELTNGYSLYMYDLSGNEVHSAMHVTNKTQVLTLDNITPGIYLLKLTDLTSGFSSVRKLVKE